MAIKKGTTRCRKPTAKFKVDERVIVQGGPTTFEGVIISRSYDDPSTSDDPGAAGWGYVVSNDPTEDGDCWLECCLHKRDEGSNIYKFPSVKPAKTYFDYESIAKKAVDIAEAALAQAEKALVSQRSERVATIHSSYCENFASCMNGLLAAGHLDSNFLVSKAHEMAIFSLRKYKEQCIK